VATRRGTRIVAKLDNLVADTTIDVIAVDMPIGLPASWGRACDVAARAYLGARRASIFPAPPRAVLHAPTYDVANGRCRELCGRGLTRQTFHLLAKIAALDALVTPAHDDRVVEAHPECAFRALTGRELAPKRTTAGRDERITALEAVFGPIEIAMAGCRPDDVLDAYALLWVAERFAAGTARVFGDGERDERGLPMRIVV
jgi:predicted RNase H-like nuclease